MYVPSLVDRRSVLCKAFFAKSVLDANSCLHYLLPPPRHADSIHRVTDLDSIYHTFRKYLKIRDIITLSYPAINNYMSPIVHSRS